jgi:hypothetical protein
MEENPSEWMTASEARILLGIGKAKLAQWLKDGTLKYEKNPFDKRVLMVRRADVEKLDAIPRPKIGTAAA